MAAKLASVIVANFNTRFGILLSDHSAKYSAEAIYERNYPYLASNGQTNYDLTCAWLTFSPNTLHLMSKWFAADGLGVSVVMNKSEFETFHISNQCDLDFDNHFSVLINDFAHLVSPDFKFKLDADVANLLLVKLDKQRKDELLRNVSDDN